MYLYLLYIIYISTYTFDMCFKIKCPGWLDVGHTEVPRESVTVCPLGDHCFLGKRDEQSVCFSVLLRVMTSTQMPRCMCRLSHPKQIMMSSGCCMVMLGIYSDDIYISLEGYKRTNARWGGDSKLDFKENRSIPPRYLGASQHQPCQKFI